MNSSKLNPALFILLACLWSGSFIGIKIAVTLWPPIFSAAVRVAIALVFFILFVKITGKNTAVPLSLRWKIWLVGFFSQALPFALLFWGEHLIAPGLAGILNGTMPIWALILSVTLFPQLNNFSLLKMFGLIIGICGIVIVFWPMVSFDHSPATLWGALAVLGMSISYAVGSLLNQHFLAGKMKIDFIQNLYHQHWGSVISLIIASLCLETWPSVNTLTTTPTAWMASLYLGIFSTAIAWVLYYHLIRSWDAVRASTVMYVVPVLALVWDYLFYGTVPAVAEIYGIVLILAGVILTQATLFKKIALFNYLKPKENNI